MQSVTAIALQSPAAMQQPSVLFPAMRLMAGVTGHVHGHKQVRCEMAVYTCHKNYLCEAGHCCRHLYSKVAAHAATGQSPGHACRRCHGIHSVKA
jgi:hypothetical protein